ncbi:elongation factor Ts, mitochondrial [Cylas formicarius]|uniref:elongation factor Ts, mitochondrial n=1 Tax=Cylas formicarius TaxID=197179 RepID=UPI002958D93A|nr:elongation factor Ts, mitochondrial [Cylas formicarius]
MIFKHTLSKYLHLSNTKFNEKSLLAVLRKKTGYTFTNCKKALDLHNNDVNKAEVWLKEQAQQLGWSKATKLEGRQTSQGLVGVALNYSGKVAALVEVNCETDFVARNKEFEKLVEEVAKTCLNYIKLDSVAHQSITKVNLDTERLKNLKSLDGKTLADKLALTIGSVGENATLKRAECVKVNEDIYLSMYAHPSGKEINGALLGRVAGLVAFRSVGKNEKDFTEVGKNICQHIVGMAPKRIGNVEEPSKEDEKDLVHQEYLLDDSLTVKDVLRENSIELIYFTRFECGEGANVVGDQLLDFVETCQ